MTYSRTEISVGAFVLAGAAILAYLSVSIGGIELPFTKSFSLFARFASAGDLGAGAVVRLAGVPVGQVAAVRLKDYAAEVELRLTADLQLPTDTIASIRTEGLLGASYVALSPGAADKALDDGGTIQQTESPIDLVDIISKYAFESDTDKAGPKPP